MTPTHIPGFTSTGSKRPGALFGDEPLDDALPLRMTRSAGCRVWDEHDRPYLDCLMGLGSVALGYGHPEVGAAATRAIADGAVGPLPPVLEEEVASRLASLMPWVEQVRFVKSGAEAVAAAVRLARAATGRELVFGSGYHGWLDWCHPGAAGVPVSAAALYQPLVFNDAEAARSAIRLAGNRLAAVVAEPVVVDEPSGEWLRVLQEETERVGAVLVLDEVKTIGRLALGGGAERYGIRPGLVAMGKAIANGFPLAAVGGRADLMAGATRTWISSTLATEFVSLAAARATLDVLERERVPAHLERVGGRLLSGLRGLAERHPRHLVGAAGVPSMCFLRYVDDATGAAVARQCARRGLLFKRSAYNFMSLAHDEATVDQIVTIVDESLSALA